MRQRNEDMKGHKSKDWKENQRILKPEKIRMCRTKDHTHGTWNLLLAHKMIARIVTFQTGKFFNKEVIMCPVWLLPSRLNRLTP